MDALQHQADKPDESAVEIFYPVALVHNDVLPQVVGKELPVDHDDLVWRHHHRLGVVLPKLLPNDVPFLLPFLWGAVIKNHFNLWQEIHVQM